MCLLFAVYAGDSMFSGSTLYDLGFTPVSCVTYFKKPLLKPIIIMTKLSICRTKSEGLAKLVQTVDPNS